ncbi:hypothetical protein [Paenibacillus rigui]|uniref:Uncharacterized protein n=1 Tax=Paenibacillus rigui TaxID=554312 RepID=A0A229UTH4_9BACL|nr:hypothetical protein [Paenibacillus rigui]OXM86465.1 hypothetical protein CF651_09825 [Paenibacillus rigui]
MSFNYKVEFEQQVRKLVMCSIMDRHVRMQEIQKLIDSYINSTDTVPDTTPLERLADYILKEELTDRNPYKVSHTSHPIMSTWQLDLRHNREVTLKVAEEIAADGKRYAVPKRRYRSTAELLLLDEQARIRNAQRAAQYEKDTAPGPIHTYFLPNMGTPPYKSHDHNK